MPEITVVHIALLALMALIGVIIGWVIRGTRSTQEKAAVNAGWQEQIDAQRTEHDRLVEQNKALMDQISQFQASNLDAKNRARELSVGMQEATARRDDLQREIKDIRSNLEVAVSQRDKLQTDMAARRINDPVAQEKDEKIFQLSRELENWHNRLPPLIERYKVRNEEARQLETDLAEARLRIEQLESAQNDNETRIEPVRDPDALTNGRGASNDPTDSQVVRQVRSVEIANDSEQKTLRDNLKQIKGIGPAIEKTLNEMGIFRFQQIAEMSEYDIDRVAQRLKGFHSRIYREDWIGQARELNDRDKSV
jgi:predicted flap endonuclease-1-like 5' DNA nuclease